MKKAILLFTIAICLASCSKNFLNNTPEDFLTGANFFKTESDFQQALVAAYATVRTAGDLNSWVMGEMRSDNTHYDINRGADASIATTHRLAVTDFLDDDGNGITNGKYNNSYVGISRTNTILDRISDVQMDEGKKDQIIAEARFLRAFFYFELVRYYGGVPLYIHEVKNPAEAKLQRASVDSVYGQIIEDATEAAAVLPPKPAELGRASKAAAETLLGYVYLTRKDYADAVNVLTDILGEGYSLLPDYRSVFDPANKGNNEMIFAAQYQDGPNGQPSDFAYRFAPQSADAYLITGVHANNITSGLNVPTPDLLKSYEPGDKRLNASVGIAEGSGATGATFVIDAVKSPVGYTAAPGKIGKPFIRKYTWPSAQSGIINQTNSNWPIYRYADVLLLLAEALTGEGKPQEALPYLNQVRQRAGLPPVQAGLSLEVMRDTIFHERRIELAFENKRWLDLIRKEKAIDIMNAYGVAMKKIDPGINPNAYHVTRSRLLFPIPRREVQIGGLTQNPGY